MQDNDVDANKNKNKMNDFSTRSLYVLMYMVAYLPEWTQKKIAWLVGRIAGQYIQKGGVAQRNIQLCFPHLNPKEIDALIIKNGGHTGKSFIEWSKARFWSDKKIRKHFPHRIEGLELLDKKDPRGVLLIMKHTLHLLADLRILGLYKAFGTMARDTDYSQFFDKAFYHGLVRCSRLGSAKPNQMLKMIRWLKNGETTLYAADHDFGVNNSVICNFFGVPAATIAAPFRIQRSMNCRICYINSYYDEDGVLVLSIRELTNLSKTNPVAFMQRINDEFTTDITKHPSQYLWSYDRFRSFTTRRLLLGYNVCASEHPTYQRIANLLKYRLQDKKKRHISFLNDVRISGVVVNKKHDKVLILKLNRPWKKESAHLWFTLGDLYGKTPDAMNIGWIALLQARQISGINDMCILSTDIFDVDVEVYKTGNFNLRYLLRADCQHPLKQPGALFTLEWVDLATPQIKCPSFIRLANKTRAYLAKNANLTATT